MVLMFEDIPLWPAGAVSVLCLEILQRKVRCCFEFQVSKKVLQARTYFQSLLKNVSIYMLL